MNSARGFLAMASAGMSNERGSSPFLETGYTRSGIAHSSSNIFHTSKGIVLNKTSRPEDHVNCKFVTRGFKSPQEIICTIVAASSSRTDRHEPLFDGFVRRKTDEALDILRRTRKDRTKTTRIWESV